MPADFKGLWCTETFSILCPQTGAVKSMRTKQRIKAVGREAATPPVSNYVPLGWRLTMGPFVPFQPGFCGFGHCIFSVEPWRSVACAPVLENATLLAGQDQNNRRTQTSCWVGFICSSLNTWTGCLEGCGLLHLCLPFFILAHPADWWHLAGGDCQSLQMDAQVSFVASSTFKEQDVAFLDHQGPVKTILA